MNEPSKDTLLFILQQRMDKCTSEQFWAVAALSALYAAIISRTSVFLPGVPRWLVAGALSAAAFYGVFFVAHRHRAYYSYRKDFAELLKDCAVAPQFMKEPKLTWELPQLTGLMFYSLWILSGYAVSMYMLVRCSS